MPDQGFGWRRITANALVFTGPVHYGGLIVRATGGGTADVTVYDGQDDGGGRYMGYTVPVDETAQFMEVSPATFETGLYITIGSNIGEVLVRYRAAD